MKVINKIFGLIIVAIIVIVICAAVTGPAKDGFLSVLSQFPLFDFMLSIVTYKAFPNLFVSGAFLSFLVELMEFVIVVFIYDWLFDNVISLIYKPTDNLVDALFRYPVKFFIGIGVRFAIVVLLSFAVGFVQNYMGSIGKALATMVIFVVACIITMLRDKEKRIIVTGLFLEVLSTIGVLSLCAGIHRGISSGIDVTGAVIFGLVLTILFGLIKGFYNYASD